MTEDDDIPGSGGQAAPRSALDADPFGGVAIGRGTQKRRWLFASLASIVVLGIALQSLLMLRSDESPQRESLLAAQAPAFELEMPDPGRDRLLSAAQLRWCLREDLRIEVFEQRLSYSEPQRFGVIVADYNRRCTRFRYLDGDLERARRDIDGARKWIVEEAFAEAYALSASAAGAKPAASGYSILTKDVQGLLRAVGFDPGPIDGHYGARTRAAVESFEAELGLKPTGAISEALRRQLLDRVRSAGFVDSRPPTARAATAAERAAIDDACLRAKLRGGEAGFDRCVGEQLAELAALESEPSVAAMTEAERAAVEARCASTGSFYGPAAFYRCAQERLAEAAAAAAAAGRRASL